MKHTLQYYKEFDLSEHIKTLENFKNNSTEAIIKHFISIENFDLKDLEK